MLHCLVLTAVVSPMLAAPPATERTPVTDTLHGVEIVDEYRWLESLESESAAVEVWTDAQNAFTKATLDSLPCREHLVEELGALMSLPSIGTPVARGLFLFNTERHGSENQSVLYVRENGGAPRVLIDPNTLDADGLISLDWWTPSRDGTMLAFGISRAGDEKSDLHVIHTRSGEWTSTELPGKVSFGGWTPAGDAFLYSQLDDPDDPYSRSVRWHTIGRNRKHDEVLATQTEPSRIPYGSLSFDGQWITLGLSDGWGINDLWLANVAEWKQKGALERRPIAVGKKAQFRVQAIIGETLYFLTTFDAPNGRLLATDVNDLTTWRTVVPEQPDAVLQGASRVPGMFVLAYEKDATSQFERIRPNGDAIGPLELPGLGSASLSTYPTDSRAFLSYTSYNEPRTIYDVALPTGESSVWAKPDVPVDPSRIVVERLWATSKDGTRVPMFVIHRDDVLPGATAPHPTLLYGYGGFNISLTPRFYATNFPWYDAGGVYVVASLRGGSEYGETWHKAGMRANKQNVFDDYYACAEALIEAGWTDPEHLAVMGGSNGGLLTGVASTQRPELFSAVVSAVPLLDMLRFDQFLMARFWVPEYGNPNEPEQFEWLHAYSPYHNIREGQRYPAILILAGENDSRVHPLHARKFAARMQWATRDDTQQPPVLLRVDRDAGHGQGKPLKMRVSGLADQWAFIMAHTGVCETPE